MSVPPPAPASRKPTLRLTRTLSPARSPHIGEPADLSAIRHPSVTVPRDFTSAKQSTTPAPPLLREDSSTPPRPIPAVPTRPTDPARGDDTAWSPADRTAGAYSADHPFYSVCSLLYGPRRSRSSVDAASYDPESTRRLLLTTLYGNGSFAQFEESRSVPRRLLVPIARYRGSTPPKGGPQSALDNPALENAPPAADIHAAYAPTPARHRRAAMALAFIAELADHEIGPLAA